MIVDRRAFIKAATAALTSTAGTARALGLGKGKPKDEIKEALGAEDDAYVKGRKEEELCASILANEKKKDLDAGKPPFDPKNPDPVLLARVRGRYLSESAKPLRVLGNALDGLVGNNPTIVANALATYRRVTAEAVAEPESKGKSGNKLQSLGHKMEDVGIGAISHTSMATLVKGGPLAHADAAGNEAARAAAQAEYQHK